MHRPSRPALPPSDLPPPAAPPLPAAAKQQTVIAPWQRRTALYHVAAGLAYCVAAALTAQWLARHWDPEWGADPLMFLSYSDMLMGPFGVWLLMVVLLLLLALCAVQFAVTAVVFRCSARRSVLLVFAWLSILSPPLGTLAGVHALRHLKVAGTAEQTAQNTAPGHG